MDQICQHIQLSLVTGIAEVLHHTPSTQDRHEVEVDTNGSVIQWFYKTEKIEFTLSYM
jgi:hypothetical protein